MKTNKLELPEIRQAINDLKTLILGKEENIESISLFGSTIKMSISKAKDIDFFIKYKNCDFETLRQDLLKVKIGRNLTIENHSSSYTNHPTWLREEPLRMHILLFQEETQFSEKLNRTKKSSIDITHLVK